MSGLTGTWQLTRFALRRDRLLLPAWVATFVLSTVSSAAATMALYPDEQSRVLAAATVNDVPVALAMYGRIWDPTSLGALALFKLTGFGSVMLAILAIMLVVRHTRTDEEHGRTELLVASVVGRWASLASAVLVASVAVVSIGVLSAIGLAAVGLPVDGSWAFGLMWIATGLAFVAVGAVCAQGSTSARIATSLGLVVVAAAYLLRAVGDVLGDLDGPAVWSWLSPLGWAQQVRPFAGDRFAVALIPLVFVVVASTLAAWLSSRRDLDGGLLHERPGPATAGAALRTPLVLAWRLQRGALIGWLVGYLLVGVLVGSLVNDLEAMLDSEQVRAMVQALGGTEVMLDAFISLEFAVMAFATAAFGVAAIRRLAAEESDGHAEPILAAAVSRHAFLASHLSVAAVGTAVLTVVQGLAFALAAAAQSGATDRIGPILGAALAYLPAIWILVGLATALYAVAPHLTSWAWVVIVALLLVNEIGPMLEWPAWVMDLSPISHVPQLPAAPMMWAPLVVMTALSIALVAGAAAAFRRRDLANA